jgi:hypothetical protein
VANKISWFTKARSAVGKCFSADHPGTFPILHPGTAHTIGKLCQDVHLLIAIFTGFKGDTPVFRTCVDMVFINGWVKAITVQLIDFDPYMTFQVNEYLAVKIGIKKKFG